MDFLLTRFIEKSINFKYRNCKNLRGVIFPNHRKLDHNCVMKGSKFWKNSTKWNQKFNALVINIVRITLIHQAMRKSLQNQKAIFKRFHPTYSSSRYFIHLSVPECQSMRARKRKRTHSQLHVYACRPELASTET